MPPSTSTAPSTIARSRVAIATCIGISVVLCIYYLSSPVNETDGSGDAAAGPGPGLQRSNAIHRPDRPRPYRPRRANRRRRSQNPPPENPPPDAEEDVFVPLTWDHGEERPVTPELPPSAAMRNELSPLDGETVIDDIMDLDDEWEGEEPPQSLRRGQNVVQLLFRVSEEATRQSAYVHRGCHCDSCGTVPIRGIRYRCANCADYDLCEACEAQQLHTKTHIFYKIRVPAYSLSSRQAQPPCYPGQPDTALSQLPRPLIARLSKETSLERQEIYAYWEQFTFMASTEWRDDPDGLCLAMDRVTFDQCLIPSGAWRSVAPNLVFDRMFAFYDTNHDGLISFPEFLNGLAFRKKKDKLKKIFEGYDIDGDGYVDRKDFLRMFRSYYTMYKALNQEFLESLNDHTMSRTEAQQLVSGRQPLSSIFGREMSINSVQDGDAHAGEGKQVIDDELEVVDGRGVINESGKDQGDRETLIAESVSEDYRRRQQGLFIHYNETQDPAAFDAAVDTAIAQMNTDRQSPSFAPDADVRDAHWDAMINPPETIDELQHNLLESLISARQQNPQQRRPPALPSNTIRRLHELGSSDLDHALRDELLRGSFNTRNWPPEYVGEEDVVTVCGQSMPFAEVPEDSRFDVIREAVRRRNERISEEETEATQGAINNRWRMRQFYTDEEEGMTRPEFYDDEYEVPEDAKVPVGVNTAVSSPPPLLSPRSRSSSKVRFAEDTDDFDIRSNFSASSRSIPERWGGMDIPEAEKDAGKDILYQATQQAFNELLDPLFKAKEDTAMDVMSTKKERERYRHVFSSPSFEEWARGIDSNARPTTDEANRDRADSLTFEVDQYWSKEYRKLDLQRVSPELFAASGYSVLSKVQLQEECTNVTPDSPEPSNPDDSPEVESYIDPTMPQNRPNSNLPRPSAPRAHFSENLGNEDISEVVLEREKELGGPVKYKEIALPFSSAANDYRDNSDLYVLRLHDKYECMAKHRGGYGRLNFQEFEKIVKKSGGKKFDYLGGWIDICIP